MILALCAALSAAAAPLLEGPGPIDATSALTWVQSARRNVNACQNDVTFLIRLGRVLRALGQPEEAAEHLERALLLAPSEPAALRAFAQALADMGDPAAARQVLSLAGPLAEAPVSVASGTPLRRAVPRRLLWRDSLSLTSGAERNLLGVTGASSLTLTLPGLDPSRPVLVTLPLDSTARPRSGAYVQAGASWQAMISSDDGAQGNAQQEWSLQAAVRWRQVPALPSAGFATVEAAAAHQRRYASTPWGHHFNATAAYLDSRTGVTYGQAGLALAADGSVGGCQARLGVDWLARRYGSNPLLDGNQASVQAMVACSTALQATLRAGRDRPLDPLRPGGVQDLKDLRIRGVWGPWAWDAEWSLIQDRSTYNALLDSGAPRRQLRRTWRLERVIYSHSPQGAGRCSNCRSQQLLVGLELQDRLSRIELFKTNNLSAFISWQITK